MNECRLINQPEFISDMDNLVSKLDTKSNTYVEEFKQGLINLKSKYKDTGEFEEAVYEYMSDEEGDFAISYIENPEQLINSIDSILQDVSLVKEEGSKLDPLSLSKGETSLAKELFIDKYFKGSSFSKLTFLKNFRNEIASALFVHNKALITTDAERNESLLDLRNSYKDIISNLLHQRINNKIADRFEFLYSRNLLEAIDFAGKLIFLNEAFISNEIIAHIPEIDTLSPQRKDLLKAYQAWVSLKHFDDLIVYNYKKAISIKHHGDYNNDIEKYSIKTADSVIHQWRDDNIDTDETDELSNLSVLFLESLKVVDKAGNLTSENLSFLNIKTTIGNLFKILDTLPGTYFMYNKLPEQVFGMEIFNPIVSEYKSIYGDREIKDILYEYVIGKDLLQVIAAAKLKPAKLMPILFRLTQPILVEENGILKNKNPYAYVFSKLIKTDDTLRSLYIQIFAANNSVLSMNITKTGFNPENSSIYLFITSTFINIENKAQIEYLNTDEGITITNLSTKINEKRLKTLIRGLEGKFDKVNPLGVTVTDSITKYNTFTLEDNLNEEKGITINTNNFKIVVEKDLTIKIFDKDNKIVNSPEFSNFIPFVQEVLDIEFNDKFINLFVSLQGNTDNVINLAAHILYNFLVGKHMFDILESEYANEISKYYKYGPRLFYKEAPKIAYIGILPTTVPKPDINDTLEKISKTKDTLEGYSETGTVTDGDNKQLSILGLSTQLAKYKEIIENFGKQEDSVIKHFSIFDLFEGVEYARDYSEIGNSKQVKKFTEEELINASILYDMYGELFKFGENDTLEENAEGILRVMGPVISDKSNIIKIRFNWNKYIKPEYNQLLRPNTPNAKLRLRDLTINDLKILAKVEFGEYYDNVINHINDSWKTINKYVPLALEELGIQLPPYEFNYLDNFKLVNENYKEFAVPIMRKAIYLALQAGEDVELIDLVHYIVNKKSKLLQNNKSLIHLWGLFKTQIVWAHPAIGKSWSVENGKYTDKLIDWDVEFNEKRNKWIEQHSNTTIGTPEFKAARNEYLVNSEAHPDFINFLTQEWIRVKNKALLEGKILVASPHLLLKLFPNDFTQVINISDSTFIHRNIIRGENDKNNSVLWKQSINKTLSEYTGNIITTDSYLEELLDNGTIQVPIESYGNFWDRKEKQLFIDFIQSGAELQVKEGTVAKKGIAIATAISKNQGWIKGENIAVAKVLQGDKSLLISNIDDFKNWFPYSMLVQSYRKKGITLPKELDIESPDVDLDAIIEAINQLNIEYKFKLKIPEIIESGVYEISNKLDELLQEGYKLYKLSRLIYNDSLDEETIIEGWKRKVEKDFKNKNRIDKKKLKEYILDKHIRLDIAEYMTGVPINDVSYLAQYEETPDPITITINPEIIKHNLYDFYLGESFVLTNSGTYVAHPANGNTLEEIEAAQFGLAVKRYVEFTASKHREEANCLNGMPEEIMIAIIEDDFDNSYNFIGESGKVKPFDGATYYSIVTNYLSNNSLGADAMGTDKKPFAHLQGIKSGIGFILKTAGFALTNARIRESKFDANLNKKMLDIKWDSPVVLLLLNGEQLDWTKDYFGNNIDYGEWFVYEQSDKGNWNYYQRKIENGIIKQRKVFSNGVNLTEWETYPKSINSNYDLWVAFGGAYSCSLNKAGELVYDESSVLRLLKACNNVGVRKLNSNGLKINKVFDQSQVNQVLKQAMIHMIPTGGAVKYGGANINPKERYFDDIPLTTMKLKTYDLGEQLDAEHTAEDGKVSLMTLVINALHARGYSFYEAQKCYKALASIANYMTGNIISAIESGNKEQIATVLTNSIYKTLLNVSDTDGDILNALAASVLNGKITKDQILEKFPISHPAIFNKIISSLASLLEKGIRLKFKGGMEVLNPSNRRKTIINGHLSGYYDTHYNELQALENELLGITIDATYKIKLGRNYKSKLNGEIYLVNGPKDLYDLEERIKNGETFYETYIDKDGIPLGRDLATYTLTFTDSDGNKYSSWELDSVRALHRYNEKLDLFEGNDLTIFEQAYNLLKHPELTTDVMLPELLPIDDVKAYLKAKYLKELNAISSNGIETTVTVNGLLVTVDSYEVDPFEIILPQIYKSIFGLREGDQITDIELDLNFFIKRQLLNWKAKITDNDVFDLELKTLDGNHIYLGLPPQDLLPSTYLKINLEYPTDFEFDGEILYRITPLGERLYSVPYTVTEKGVIPDIQIYKDKATNTEIIYSNNLTHFLNEFSYNKIIFANNENDKVTLLRLLNASTNRNAQNKINVLKKLANQRSYNRFVKSNKDTALIKNLFNNILENFEDEVLSEIATIESMSDLQYDKSLEELLSENLDIIEQLVQGDQDYTARMVKSLEEDVQTKKGLELINDNKFFKGMILSGIEVHTSFLESLEAVVSRTPAQSQLSFMAMKVVAFGTETTNSAYVSRDQLWLLGSDYALK